MQLMIWDSSLIAVRKLFHQTTLFHLSITGKQLVLQMKLTAFLLFIACIHISAGSCCQKVTFSGRHVPLQKVFSAIEKQTGYLFFFNYNIFDSTRPITLTIKDANLDDALKAVFAGQPLEYTIDDKTISIKKRTTPLLSTGMPGATTPPVWIDIRGVVTDEKGDAAEGILVKVKGTINATVTNNKGEFSLVRVDANATLVLTSVNMETLETKVNGRTDLSISLQTKIMALAEVAVQVNTGYQAIPKERATGSFAQVDNTLINRSVSTDILSRLKGVASGVLFDNSLSKSSNTLQISIRGISSIYSNITPLVVVDNFPYDGDLNNINPNDIESITVLKDAAAASIWGVRAGNGVIVIVTKKGKLNQPIKMELNTNVTVSQTPDLFYDPNFMNAADFINVEQFLFNKGFYDADISSGYKPNSPVVDILAQQRAGTISAANANAQINALSKLDVRNDLSKYFYQKAVNQQYAINVSGGSDKTSYVFSAGFDQNLLNQVGNGYSRATLNGYSTFLPVKNLEITVGFTYTQSITRIDNTLNQIITGGPSNRQRIYPYAQFADAQGNPLPIVKDYSTAYVEAAPGNGFLNWQFFPLKELGLTDNTTKGYDTRIYTGAKYSLLRGLSAEIKYQYENGITQNRALVPQESYYTSNLINQYAVVSGGEVTGYNIPLGDILDNNSTNLIANSLRGQLNYINAFRKHNITAIIGAETRETRIDGNNSRLYGYNDATGTFQSVNYNTYYTLNPLGTATIFDNNTIVPYTLNRFRSWFSNASYTYNNRYTISASARVDGSNLFGVNTNQKFVPLWSAGIKWDVDKEPFYHWEGLPYLKLRTTYGYSGNMNNTLSAYTTTRATVGNIINLPYASAIAGDLSLTWERTSMLTIGLDFGTTKQIVTGSIEYYCKRGIGLIGSSAIPSSTGFLSAQGNYSSMKGNGMDISINSRNIDKVFKWSTTLLISTTMNTITQNSATTASIYSIKAVGKPVNGVFVYRWGGLDPTTGDPRGYLDNVISNGWSNIASAALTNTQTLAYKGSANPTLFGSLRNIFSWKCFSVSANIIVKAGYYFFRNSINYYSLYNSWTTNKDYSKRWQKPGDEKITNVPSMVYPANSARDNFYLGSEALVEKGDHIRLQDIRFSYDIDKKQWKALPLSYVQLYVYANNLGILWRANHYGIDPDYQTGYPVPVTFSVGVKAGL